MEKATGAIVSAEAEERLLPGSFGKQRPLRGTAWANFVYNHLLLRLI